MWCLICCGQFPQCLLSLSFGRNQNQGLSTGPDNSDPGVIRAHFGGCWAPSLLEICFQEGVLDWHQLAAYYKFLEVYITLDHFFLNSSHTYFSDQKQRWDVYFACTALGAHWVCGDLRTGFRIIAYSGEGRWRESRAMSTGLDLICDAGLVVWPWANAHLATFPSFGWTTSTCCRIDNKSWVSWLWLRVRHTAPGVEKCLKPSRILWGLPGDRPHHPVFPTSCW